MYNIFAPGPETYSCEFAFAMRVRFVYVYLCAEIARQKKSRTDRKKNSQVTGNSQQKETETDSEMLRENETENCITNDHIHGNIHMHKMHITHTCTVNIVPRDIRAHASM